MRALAPLVVLLCACGGTTAPVVTVTPLTAEDEIAFDNGADLIEDPSLLDGPALESWESDIAMLCDRADAVAIIRITAVQTSVDLERNESYRLIGDVELEHFGDVEESLSLIVRENEAGYQSIRRAEPRLLNQQFVVFIRWTEGDTGALVPRWHLSPAAERVTRRVNTLIERRRPHEDRRRVIVHDRRDEDDESEE